MITTKYFYELGDGRRLELPFDPESDEVTLIQHNDEILLGCLVRDDDSPDPLVDYDEFAFVQFESEYIHCRPRPEPEDFKETIRENKGRVFYVESAGDGYEISHEALLKNAGDIDIATGYLIVPADVTSPAKYAQGVMAEYSSWCEGDVWGVCVWHYDAETLDLRDRDECWGCYGSEYAEQVLKERIGNA